jgi:biotin-(acetyl-CoA carboxylase) ligase
MGRLLGELRRAAQEGGEVLGPEELRAFASMDASAGKRVQAELGGVGVARGISERGALLLDVEGQGVQEIRAGSLRII